MRSFFHSSYICFYCFRYASHLDVSLGKYPSSTLHTMGRRAGTSLGTPLKARLLSIVMLTLLFPRIFMKLMTLSLTQNTWILLVYGDSKSFAMNLFGALSGLGGFRLTASLFLILLESKKFSSMEIFDCKLDPSD